MAWHDWYRSCLVQLIIVVLSMLDALPQLAFDGVGVVDDLALAVEEHGRSLLHIIGRPGWKFRSARVAGVCKGDPGGVHALC